VATLALALAAPTGASAAALIKVKCTDSCKIKIDGKRGEKISESEWHYREIPEGIWEVETSRGFDSGYADIPAEGEVEILVSRGTLKVNGQDGLDRRGKRKLEKQREEEKDAREKAEKEARKAEKDAQEQAEKDARKAEKQAAEKGAKEKEAEKRAADEKPKEKPRAVKIAVVRLTARVGIDQQTADLYADALVAELRKRPGLAITDRNDIAALVGAEKEKSLLGCEGESCIAELGGALGVERIIHGTVGRIEKSLLVNLTLVDTKAARPVTVGERLKSSSNEAFFDALPDMVDKLLSGTKK